MECKKNLVLLPGLNNTAAIWDGVVKKLDDEFNCYPITCPPINNIDKLGKELLNELPESFYLCGFSFGGFVALSMLLQEPERIEGFILMATSPSSDTTTRKKARVQAVERAKAGEYEKMISSQKGKLFYKDNGEKPEFIALRKKMQEDYGAHHFIAHQQASIERPDRMYALRQYKGPILIMAGSDDQVFPSDKMQELSSEIKHSYFIEIPKSGHMLPMEQPEEIANELRNWIFDMIIKKG
ncbi:alpha/beta hydrolase [Sporosarcina sp. PTS2304]|uniref:alpha/beta fold hydrolase n=1 Tax=Sporosarcina sp. PTS2304 TaxID=2283194 RepID=UPI000E0D5D2B|nr:alpha/beta hydrolase [Sporosarcina sp. PTS2304]AXH99551.1 alpha/beta hydrolase [Sporosarcina sp. PTS2304]